MSAPKTVTRDIYIHYDKYDEEGIIIFNCDMSRGAYGIPFLGKVSVTFEIPEADPVTAQIEMLEKEITKIQADTHIKVTNLKDRIQSLLAIGHD